MSVREEMTTEVCVKRVFPVLVAAERKSGLMYVVINGELGKPARVFKGEWKPNDRHPVPMHELTVTTKYRHLTEWLNRPCWAFNTEQFTLHMLDSAFCRSFNRTGDGPKRWLKRLKQRDYEFHMTTSGLRVISCR